MQAPAAAPLVTAPAMLPGNLLSPADSDFELGTTGNWAAFSNCTVTVVNPAENSFSGSGALKVVATAAGTVEFFAGAVTKIPIGALRGIDMSGYVFTTSSGHNVTSQPWWYTTGSGFLSFGPVSLAVTGPAGTWIPSAAASASPANAGLAQLFFFVTGMAAGEALWFDFAYVAMPAAQIICSWPDEPATAGPRFCDLTPFARADTPVSMTRGRQDNISDVQAGQCSILFADDTGWLTPQHSASPWFPNVKIGRRLQVNVPDETGTWHTRFDGQITELAPVSAPTGLQTDCATTASDILAMLNRQGGLDSWTKREILLDSPALHWTLDDPAGSPVAAESSGNNGPPLQPRQWGTGGTYAFAGGTAVSAGLQQGMETQTWTPVGTPAAFPSVYFAQAHSGLARTAQANWQLQAPLPAPITTGTGTNTTVEAFLMTDVPNVLVYLNATPYTFISFTLGNSRTGAILGVQVAGGAAPALKAFYYSNWPDTPPTGLITSASTAWNAGTPGATGVAVVIIGSDSGASAALYVAGTLVGTITLPKGAAFNWITCGGPLGGYSGWLGQVSCLSVYNTAIPAARLLSHHQAARSARYNQISGSVIQGVANYAGIPSFWNNLPFEFLTGLSNVDYFTLQGISALQAMQQAEASDGGILYTDAAGRLNYAGREVRMGARGPVLTLQPGQYEPDLAMKTNDQYLINAAAYSSPGISTGVAAQNSASVADYGSYSTGTPASPTEIWAQTYNTWYQAYLNAAASGAVSGAFSADNLTWAAQWAANIKAQPANKCASVRLDLLTLGAAFLAGDATGLAPSAALAREINDVISLPNLGPQFPDLPHSAEYFIEGVTESIGLGIHDITFYTTPASQGRAWIPGDPAYGQLDSTAVIGLSAAAAPVSVPNGEFAGSLYPGPPYYPPSYGPTMNKTGFAGALDQAGIWANLQQQLQPPLAVIAQGQNNQSVANNTPAVIVLDSIYIDTLGGTGLLNGFPNWYFVLVPGWYQLYGAVEYASNASGRRFAWFEVAQKALGAAAGPVAGNTNNIATASVMPPSTANVSTAQCSAKIYCTLGTAISLWTKQTSGGALNTGTTRGGSILAIRFLGDTATED